MAQKTFEELLRLKKHKGKRVCVFPAGLAAHEFMRIPELTDDATEVAMWMPPDPKAQAQIRRAVEQLATKNPKWSQVLLIASGDTRYDRYFDFILGVGYEN
jgi:hypothetical protein